MTDGDAVKRAEEAKEQNRDFPVKCDHCPWTGTIAHSKLVETSVRCPKCGGSLAGNRTIDKLMDAADNCGVFGNGNDW